MKLSNFPTTGRMIVFTVLSIITCLITQTTVYAYDVPVNIGPDLLEEDQGDGIEEPENDDEPGDPPLSGTFSLGGGVHYEMAMNSLTAQNFEVHNRAQVEFWAPRIVLKRGFRAKPDEGDGYFRAGIPVFDVNCINLVNPDPLSESNRIISVPLPVPSPSRLCVSGSLNAGYDCSANPNICLDNSGNSYPALCGEAYDNFFAVDGDDEAEFRKFCENEIAILNYHFANEYGNQLIKFRLRNAVEWRWDLSTVPSNMDVYDEALYYCLNAGNPYPTAWGTSVCSEACGPGAQNAGAECKKPDGSDNCEDSYGNPDPSLCVNPEKLINNSTFVDPDALSMFYYRFPSDKSNISFGNANPNGTPYVLINHVRSDTALLAPDEGDRNGGGADNYLLDDDWQRAAAQEHEMGHAFWVQHTWDERIDPDNDKTKDADNSNIMNTGDLSYTPSLVCAPTANNPGQACSGRDPGPEVCEDSNGNSDPTLCSSFCNSYAYNAGDDCSTDPEVCEDSPGHSDPTLCSSFCSSNAINPGVACSGNDLGPEVCLDSNGHSDPTLCSSFCSSNARNPGVDCSGNHPGPEVCLDSNNNSDPMLCPVFCNSYAYNAGDDCSTDPEVCEDSPGHSDPTLCGNKPQSYGYDRNGYFCFGGWGNRDKGFWVEPFDIDDSGNEQVCHCWVNSNMDYTPQNGPDSNDDRGRWSQVEIIYYVAKHYKQTWDK